MDREKIIKGLECHVDLKCNDCPYVDAIHPGWGCHLEELITDTLAMLKKQKAVKPRVSTVEQRCGNCNKVIKMDGWITCPWCGNPILWEAVGRSVKWE